MRKRFSIALVTCSLLLVLGHSFMPHKHFLFISMEQSISAYGNLSLAELIKMTLSQDLGANHLEEYTGVGYVDAVAQVAVPSLVCIDDQDEIEYQRLISIQGVLVFCKPRFKGAYFLTFGLRAPPSSV